MAPSRLLILTGLSVAGALCAGTAASVYTATLPRRDMHVAAKAAGQAAERATDWDEGADPRSPLLKARAADRGLPAERRLRTLHTLAVGACLNPREMLFGVQAARRNGTDSLGRVLADIPARPTALAAARSVLDAFEEATEVWSDRSASSPHAPETLRRIVPDRLARRVILCRTLLAD